MFSDAINICKSAIQAVFDWAFDVNGLFASIGGLGFIVFF